MHDQRVLILLKFGLDDAKYVSQTGQDRHHDSESSTNDKKSKSQIHPWLNVILLYHALYSYL